MEHDIDIFLSQKSSLADDIISDFVKEAKNLEIKLFIDKEKESNFVLPMPTIETMVSTGIFILLVKPYLQTLLTEAAKDHYELLKNALKKLTNKIFKREKNQFKYRNEKPLSITFETVDGKRVQFILHEEKSPEIYKCAIDKLFEIIKSHYSEFPNDKLSEIFSEFPCIPADAPLRYISELNDWRMLIEPPMF